MPLEQLQNGSTFLDQRTKINTAFSEVDSLGERSTALEAKEQPAGGSTGDVLTKVSGTNYDAAYVSPSDLSVLATGAADSRQMSGWTSSIDGLVGDDYGYGSNIELAREFQKDTVIKSISDHRKNIERGNVNLFAGGFFPSLYIQLPASDSAIESNTRLIDPDFYDISFEVVSESTSNNSTIISQSLSSNTASREMQIFHDTTNSAIVVIVRGVTKTLLYTGSHKGKYRVKFSASEQELTLWKDGVIMARQSSAATGTASEPTATTVLTARHISGDPAQYSNGYAGGVLRDFKIYKKKQIVILGASIMNGAFSDTNEAVKYLHTIGSSIMDLKEFAVGGNKTSDTLAALPATLAAVTEPSLFVIHIGGNNVSAGRPFATSTSSAISSHYSELVDIITQIKAAGHEVCIASLTYRAYPNLTNENQGSLPYNKSIYEPLIRSESPEWWDYKNNKPVLDLYQWSKDNQNYLQADGVHYTAEGYAALRGYILDTISAHYEADFYSANLDNYDGTETQYSSTTGESGSMSGVGVSLYDTYIGIGGKKAYGIVTEGIGSQLLLKNKSGAVISAGAIVDASDLAQVFFDSAGLLSESVDALPTGSKWRLLNGGTAPADATKHFVRVL